MVQQDGEIGSRVMDFFRPGHAPAATQVEWFENASTAQQSTDILHSCFAIHQLNAEQQAEALAVPTAN